MRGHVLKEKCAPQLDAEAPQKQASKRAAVALVLEGTGALSQAELGDADRMFLDFLADYALERLASDQDHDGEGT